MQLSEDYSKGENAIILKNNKIYGKYPLSNQKEIIIANDNEDVLVKISDGKIWIEDTNCPNKICKKMGKISKPGEIIVCVPFKLLIEIQGEKKSPEAITR